MNSMDLINPNQNNDEIIPEQAVRFVEFRPEPQEDAHKIRIFVKKTSAKESPTLEIEIRDLEQNLIADTVIISAFQKDFVFTMHIPDYVTEQKSFVLIGKIIFEEPIGLVHQEQIPFQI